MAIFVLVDLTATGIDSVVPWLAAPGGSGNWMTWDLLIIPPSILVIQLTGRRYGPGTSFLQIALAWVAAGAALLILSSYASENGESLSSISLRGALALGFALFAAQLIAAVTFDGMRCFRWWQAPLASGLWASLVFACVYYPLAFIGGGQPWFSYLLAHAGIMAVETLLVLFPYWLFRPLIRPLPCYAAY